MHFIERMYALQNETNHGLSKDNLRKFQTKLKFWQLFWMKFYNYLTISLVILILGTFYLIIYVSQYFNFYLIILLLFFVVASYIAVEVMSMSTLGIVFIYATALYLRMRFQQITQQFEGISAKNSNSLQSLIREHNRITVMTKKCDMVFQQTFRSLLMVH